MLSTGLKKKSVQNVRYRTHSVLKTGLSIKKIRLKNVQRPRHSQIHVVRLAGKDVEGRKEDMVTVYHG
jgi:hypothetical protein